MDIYKAILKLREEKQRLDRAIAALEKNAAAGADHPRRRSWNGWGYDTPALEVKRSRFADGKTMSPPCSRPPECRCRIRPACPAS